MLNWHHFFFSFRIDSSLLSIKFFFFVLCKLLLYLLYQYIIDFFEHRLTMSLIDTITAHLPTAPGILPKWLLFISVVSIFNSIQTYVNLALTKEVYANKPEQVTPLCARTFGTWTIISAVIRYFAAYHINDINVYNICIASYCVALWHFGSEWIFYRSCKFDKGLFGPLIVSTCSITWMLSQREFYTGVVA